MPETQPIYATGKRKTAVARIWLKAGAGNLTVNEVPADEYFERMTSRMVARQSLELLEVADKYEIRATVAGGGHSAQAGFFGVQIEEPRSISACALSPARDFSSPARDSPSSVAASSCIRGFACGSSSSTA